MISLVVLYNFEFVTYVSRVVTRLGHKNIEILSLVKINCIVNADMFKNVILYCIKLTMYTIT